MAVVELDTNTFEQTIQNNDFVVVDYWAPWCGPCRSFAPVYEKVSNDFDDIVFAKLNTEEHQEIAAHFQIRSIPTLMIFREQIIIFSQAGALPEGGFRELLSKAKELDMADVKRQIAEQASDNA
ncbi:thioredoxin [Thiorhodococcus drewsii AZ1]|uniref:Thioredoxin n=1 Tax=Thiorhodococcus drewsii AZ1 TaxID=765913 RepID=G2DZ43_9GAMM|nr:thioredoxin [Thiorhodococcus drewsii]EGV32397.1 thioredoxin [Thiorhodococcus drewsii AZ1]